MVNVRIKLEIYSFIRSKNVKGGARFIKMALGT